MTDPASGFFVINKPSGITSFTVVRNIKRVMQVKRVGHCGTLDPLATGVLVVVFGTATRRQADFMAMPKTYRAVVRLGTKTDSGDITGAVTATADTAHLSFDAIRAVAARFVGDIEQIPPMYSALKWGGRRLYDLAREGRTVERAPRSVHISAIDCVRFEDPLVEIVVDCSRGTYIRTLAEDIGAALGCGGTIEKLCREKIGIYSITNALDGATINTLSREELCTHAQPIEGCQ
ncbi:MAG: tRNA pseudouridine(55) synthase TruB [Elusimicrobia bacterium]|nr:tRNA pseudouridine(55) synthase TruB [Elusimicrobiota bacterium]